MHQLPQRIFIAGIGTGVGKTLVSAILAEALQADYWKPVQCGNLSKSDSLIVRSLISNPITKIHPETFRLKTASSPHYAAKAEGVEIKLSAFKLPVTNSTMLIEAAGGLLVPLNNKDLVIDLAVKLKAPVILVARNYLGSINHTLLSLDTLGQNGVAVAGIIYSGKNYRDNEQIIYQFSKIKTLGRVDEAKTIDSKFVKRQAEKLRKSLSENFELPALK